jgi:hypothetical protein
MSSILVSTTTKTIMLGPELSYIEITHPTKDLNLLELFDRETILTSVSLWEKVSLGELVVKNSTLNEVTAAESLDNSPTAIVKEAVENFNARINLLDLSGYGVYLNGNPLLKSLDIYKYRDNNTWSISNDDWQLIPGFIHTSKSQDKSDYKISYSLLVEGNSNSMGFEIAIFVNYVGEDPRSYTLDKKGVTNSVSIITFIESIDVNTIIIIGIRRTSKKNSPINVTSRSLIIEEI